MTPKQQRFVEEYLVDLNATQTAIRAGYQWATTTSKFYVYFLVDDRDGSIFYVGKGKGKRAAQHRRDARSTSSTNQVKAARINACGGRMSEVIFTDGLDEPEALRIEKDLIVQLRSKGLTNIASGNVHPLEAELARIDNGIAAIRPFDEWMAVARPDQIDSVTKLKGSPEAFYRFFVEAYARLRGETVARLERHIGSPAL